MRPLAQHRACPEARNGLFGAPSRQKPALGGITVPFMQQVLLITRSTCHIVPFRNIRIERADLLPMSLRGTKSSPGPPGDCFGKNALAMTGKSGCGWKPRYGGAQPSPHQKAIFSARRRLRRQRTPPCSVHRTVRRLEIFHTCLPGGVD